jgi:hypothetical protein
MAAFPARFLPAQTSRNSSREKGLYLHAKYPIPTIFGVFPGISWPNSAAKSRRVGASLAPPERVEKETACGPVAGECLPEVLAVTAGCKTDSPSGDKDELVLGSLQDDPGPKDGL